jgi:hypothetical protein
MARFLALLSLLVVAAWLSAGAQAQSTPMPQMPIPPGPGPSAQPPTPPPLPPPAPAPAPAPAPQPAEAPEWFYGLNGQAMGPVTVGQLTELVASGQITGDTPVWKQGMAAWQRLAETPELAPVLAAAPKPDGSQPPPPPDTQTLLNETMKKFLIGTWLFDGPITQGGVTAFLKVEITYRPDGSYAGVQSLQMPPMGGIQSPPQIIGRSGRWTVSGVSNDQFVLNMTEYASGPIQVSLKILDPNTVEDTGNLLRSHRIR